MTIRSTTYTNAPNKKTNPAVVTNCSPSGRNVPERAEAYAKEPALGDALADLNVIRTRAHIPALSAGDMKPGKTMLEYVLEERRKELAFEGHRRFDIFRNGLTMNRTYPGTHDRGAATSVRLTISADDPAAIEFIPQREIDSYPGVLEQNP